MAMVARTLLFMCILWAALFPADSAESAGQAAPLTVDEVIGLETAESFTLSADGRWLAWVRTSPDLEKNDSRQNIFLTHVSDTFTVQVTRESGQNTSPVFSPDGKKLAYLSAREKATTQIYLYDLRGGEPEKLTGVRNGVLRIAWRDDRTILFTAREDSTYREQELARRKDTTVIVADQERYPPVRLFSIDIESKEILRRTMNEGVITEFSASPDGRWVVTNDNQDVNFAYDNKNPPRQFLVDLRTGERREIITAPYVAPYDFQWDGANKGFYCRRPKASDSTDTYVSIDELYYYDLDTGRLARFPLGWDHGVGASYGVVKDGIVVSLAHGVRDDIAFYRVPGKGRPTKQILRTRLKKSMRLSTTQRNGGRIVYAVSDASTIPVEMTAMIRNGRLQDEKKILELNGKLKKKTLSKTEIVRWKGALGDDVEGILYHPLEYETGKRYPLIALIHGGPSAWDPDFFTERYSNYPHLLASKGAFVLKVNYHGSGNYGLAWVESIKGRYYEYEVPDILSGIDAQIDRGLVDPDRLGVMGWSNGSILSIAACLESDRFKVLCAGAGDVNWTSDYGNCAFGAAFDNAYFGGPPWDNVDVYVAKSPLFRMRDLKTPTLIMFGTEDTAVPTEQGWQHFRAMQQIGAAPVRFLLFPGEPHGIRKPAHRKRKIEEELVWFDKYLFESYEKPNEAVDESSLLALGLKKARLKRSGRFYGETAGTVLLPETVLFQEMKIGRLEITRAQYRAFKPDYVFPVGTENFPATGVAFDDALGYCRWISERSGRKFRLLKVGEMGKLLEAAQSNLASENNFEHWAGYDTTPEERDQLSEKIRELETQRLLVEEAASFRPVGDEPVYDLGGNAAEWAVDENGRGRVMGLAAVSTRDRRVKYETPPSKYVGFRVCEE